MMSPLLKGLIIGFSIAAPVGPIGLLCIRRALSAGRLAGFVSGLGAATADAIYGVAAALGLTAVTNVLLQQQNWLRLGGGMFLLYLGVSTVRAKTATGETRNTAPQNLWSAYASTFALTLTNPMTILSFIGIFAGLGLDASKASTSGATLLVFGVFLGSAAWWLILRATAGWLGARLQHGGLRVVNIISGLILAGFGAGQLVSLI
jgi:threonine/homoserine/homoserine lactone efflux protein